MTQGERVTDHRGWRVGSDYGIHLYAVNRDGSDEPIGTALNDRHAKQIVREHNERIYPDLLPPYAKEIERLTEERDGALKAGDRVRVAFLSAKRENAKLRQQLRNAEATIKVTRNWLLGKLEPAPAESTIPASDDREAACD